LISRTNYPATDRRPWRVFYSVGDFIGDGLTNGFQTPI
jgi:hypothetical protein